MLTMSRTRVGLGAVPPPPLLPDFARFPSVTRWKARSLTCPASRHALYTLKPTPGSTPGGGCFNPAPSMCATGFLAKSARDLIDGTALLTGKSYDEKVLRSGWEGLKVGVLEDERWLAPETMCPRTEHFKKTQVSQPTLHKVIVPLQKKEGCPGRSVG